MILDKFYCSKRRDAFTLHLHENQFVITGDEIYIEGLDEVKAFLKSIEHKNDHKLFEKIDIDAYLAGLLKLRKVEIK